MLFRSFTRQLIELYGTPYPSEVGPGKTYAQGYTGPDLLEWFIVDRPYDTSGGWIDTAATVTLSAKVPTGVANFTGFALDDVTNTFQNNFATRTVTIQPAQYVQYSDVWAGGTSMGQRSVTGRLQQALVDADQARLALRQASDVLQNKYSAFNRRRELAQAMVQAHEDQAALSETQGKKIEVLRQVQAAMEIDTEALQNLASSIYNMDIAISEAPPKSVGLANDVTSAMRAAFQVAGGLAKAAMENSAFIFETIAKRIEMQREDLQAALDDQIAEIGFSYQQSQVIYEYELAMRDLATGFYQIAQLANKIGRAHV